MVVNRLTLKVPTLDQLIDLDRFKVYVSDYLSESMCSISSNIKIQNRDNVITIRVQDFLYVKKETSNGDSKEGVFEQSRADLYLKKGISIRSESDLEVIEDGVFEYNHESKTNYLSKGALLFINEGAVELKVVGDYEFVPPLKDTVLRVGSMETADGVVREGVWDDDRILK